MLPYWWAYLTLAQLGVILTGQNVPEPYDAATVGACEMVAFAAIARLGRRRIMRQVLPGRTRTVHLKGRVQPRMVMLAKTKLRRAAKKSRPVIVTINSAGGELVSAHAIAELISSYGGPIRVLVVHRCMSAAVTILCSVPLSDRFALPDMSIMIHPSRRGKGKKPTVNTLTSEAWIKGVERSTGVDDWLITSTAKNTSLDPLFIEMLFATGADAYFNAENARKNGFVSTIIK